MNKDSCQLSIIIPTVDRRQGVARLKRLLRSRGQPPKGGDQISRKAQVERAVSSILNQNDPIGTEIIVVEDGTHHEIEDHLRDNFSHAIIEKRLVVRGFPHSGDPSKVRNEGAKFSRGTFLAFLDPSDHWKSNALGVINSQLKRRTELVFSISQKTSEERDADLGDLMDPSKILPSSIIVRNSLFEKVGGFPSGYYGKPFPKRIPGLEVYEFLLKCFFEIHPHSLEERESSVRISDLEHSRKARINSGDHIDIGAPYYEGLMDKLRGKVSLIHSLRRVPTDYWALVGKKFIGR